MAEGDLVWKYNAGKAIKSGIVVDSNGVIYFGTMYSSGSAKIIALNSDGSLKWSYVDNDAIYSGLALSNDEGTVYAGDDEDYLRAINTNTGNLVWSYTEAFMGGIYAGIIVDDDDNVYFGTGGKGLISVDKDGNFRWRVGDESNSGLAIGKSNTVIYYLDVLAGLREIDLTDGSINWGHQGISWGCYGTGIQIGSDRTIYYGDCSYFFAVNSDGTAKWNFPIANYAGTNNAIGSNENIWFVDLNGGNTKVYVVNSSGSEVWHYDISNWIGSGLAATGLALGSNDVIFAGCHDDKLYALNPNGTLRWTYTAGNIIQSGIAFSPSEDTVYFGCDDGYLYAIESVLCGKISVGDKVFLLPIGNYGGNMVALKSGNASVTDKALIAPLDKQAVRKLAFRNCKSSVNNKVVCAPIGGTKKDLLAVR